jgi:hypothetical protein
MNFKEYLSLCESLRNSVWLRGEAKGHEIGLHGSIWGTLDEEEANAYASQFQDKGGGAVKRFQLAPNAKVLEVNGDKYNLISKLWNWTPEIEEAVRAARGDHRLAMQYMGITPKEVNPKNWYLTDMDIGLAQKLKISGYDAAILEKEWKGQIVVVNMASINWIK